MSVQELSAQMGISLPKAYELVKTPGFPTIRIGARILIPIEAYKEWQRQISNHKKFDFSFTIRNGVSTLYIVFSHIRW